MAKFAKVLSCFKWGIGQIKEILQSFRGKRARFLREQVLILCFHQEAKLNRHPNAAVCIITIITAVITSLQNSLVGNLAPLSSSSQETDTA